MLEFLCLNELFPQELFIYIQGSMHGGKIDPKTVLKMIFYRDFKSQSKVCYSGTDN